ncbi:MAG TPA: MBL fold metallo-hydrolase [Polyangiaceae bacterium]|nr:MBL fold metallo-hydrolase [Polyangiaceae bacterium]
MIFRQLFDQDSATYTYLLGDEKSRQALLIDPVLEQFDRDVALLDELELQLVAALDTHVHADHVTALGLLGQRRGARTIVSERAGSVCADRLVKEGDRVPFGQLELEVRETPGHTNGCLTYVCHDAGIAFTGDALLIRGTGRTDFQQGSSAALYRSVHERIFSLPEATLLYPAHDYKGRTVSSVGEEKRHNPRLAIGKSLADFERVMAELHLPRPKKMDVAVPANLACGVAPFEASSLLPVDTSWAPLSLASNGIPELDAAWLAEHRHEVEVLDVREPDEFRGELGHLPNAKLLPLNSLAARGVSFGPERPLVVVCRSGGRSGKAALLLRERGFTRIASLAGGMTEWNARGLPVEYGGAHGVERQG